MLLGLCGDCQSCSIDSISERKFDADCKGCYSRRSSAKYRWLASGHSQAAPPAGCVFGPHQVRQGLLQFPCYSGWILILMLRLQKLACAAQPCSPLVHQLMQAPVCTWQFLAVMSFLVAVSHMSDVSYRHLVSPLSATAGCPSMSWVKSPHPPAFLLLTN